MNSAFHEAIALSVAEFSMTFRPTQEQLNAVNTYISVLLNMGEDIKTREWPKTERLLQPEEILEMVRTAKTDKS